MVTRHKASNVCRLDRDGFARRFEERERIRKREEEIREERRRYREEEEAERQAEIDRFMAGEEENPWTRVIERDEQAEAVRYKHM